VDIHLVRDALDVTCCTGSVLFLLLFRGPPLLSKDALNVSWMSVPFREVVDEISGCLVMIITLLCGMALSVLGIVINLAFVDLRDVRRDPPFLSQLLTISED